MFFMYLFIYLSIYLLTGCSVAFQNVLQNFLSLMSKALAKKTKRQKRAAKKAEEDSLRKVSQVKRPLLLYLTMDGESVVFYFFVLYDFLVSDCSNNLVSIYVSFHRLQ